MATTGIAPIKQGIVQALRANIALKALVGSDGIQEGVEPRGGEYPYIIYSFIHTYREWDSTGVMLVSDLDVWSISDDQVQAHTLDQLVADALEDKVLTLTSSGQTSLFCRRIGDLSSSDFDGAGTRVFQMCGVYRVWTDQQRTA